MENRKTLNPSVSINLRKPVVRINKDTISAIGNPEYIILLVNPDECSLGVCPGVKNDTRSHCISKYNNNRNTIPFWISLLNKVLANNFEHSSTFAKENLKRYQRDLSEAYIRRAVENFDLYQINPVKVSRRDGLNYVINGQHTIEIVTRKSESRETPVWCMIYDDLEYTHEADIFANQQKYVKPLTPYDIFAANIEAGNEEQLTIS